jgi:transketolase N-terminal domain/subunit
MNKLDKSIGDLNLAEDSIWSALVVSTVRKTGNFTLIDDRGTVDDIASVENIFHSEVRDAVFSSDDYERL